MSINRNPSPMPARKPTKKLNTRRPYPEHERLRIMRDAAAMGIKPAIRKYQMRGDRTCREWIDVRLGTWQEMLSEAVKAGNVAAQKIALNYHIDRATGEIMRRYVDGVSRENQDAVPGVKRRSSAPNRGQTLVARVARLEAEVARLTAITDRL
jgi:uncharacterized protein YceH (UPF0502 family)